MSVGGALNWDLEYASLVKAILSGAISEVKL